MTTREFYLSVINGTGTSEETMQKARELLEKHDASNDKRKSADTKEKKEAAARREAVLNFINEQTEPVTRDTIAGCLEMSPSQASAACKSLIESGAVQKSEIKVDKTRKVAYSKA